MNIIIGCGYLGRELCELLPEHNAQALCCVVSSQASAEQLSARGLPAQRLNLDELCSDFEWPQLTHSNIYFLHHRVLLTKTISVCEHS